jgi:hypothetical protein
MIVFDKILSTIVDVLRKRIENLKTLGSFIVNRDLNGRIRLIFDESLLGDDNAKLLIEEIGDELSIRLEPHAFPSEKIVMFERCLESIKADVPAFQLDGFENVTIVDRLAVETDWLNIRPTVNNVPHVVFFAVKGGVGRSTAIAATAWALAQKKYRVMVIDLDLESPGLSSYLLPEEKRPEYGVTDWLVEDLVDNGDTFVDGMFALSELSHDGAIYVVPAHGKKPGEYVSKLGRAWMPKISAEGKHESWSGRLDRLLGMLEERLNPDIVLIDSRAGIDETASACITYLGARKILLFAIDSEQTWTGYGILLKYWSQTGSANKIRDRLQIVGAMIPEVGREQYTDKLCEHAWDLFRDSLYDEIPAGDVGDSFFTFDKPEESAPHFPWKVLWNRSFASLQSLHYRMLETDENEVSSIFGQLIDGVSSILKENVVDGNE